MDGALYDPKQDNKLTIPANQKSCWQMYKHFLKWDRKSIDNLEDATAGILHRLSLDTTETGPIKGLVIGHVQSGKTANMEALMSMAADHGWNFFIVLSGTIENLRQQTLKRMEGDLNGMGNGLLSWINLEHPSKQSPVGYRPQDLKLVSSATRYFTVCLKVKSRLQKLIDWIHMDAASHRQLKILIIDDEADQAGISNTAVNYGESEEEKERKGINKLIVDLVNDEHYKNGKTNGRAQAINYVMYTATPYANFLNESSDTSLYPSDFIWTLKTPADYIGPNQIFGTEVPENDGLDIKRIIPEEDVREIRNIYLESTSDLPQSLKDSICWFICAVSAMRYWEYKKPISMLIHTSQKQSNHETIANAVSEWVNREIRSQSLIEKCRAVYLREVRRISRNDWIFQNPNYGSIKKIRDYPKYEEIEPYIHQLLSMKMKYIQMTDEGDLKYTKGLHLVVDNCANNRVTEENEHIRLAYPDPAIKPYPSPAPAFIIIGGSTLSRGLTIEGLVSTYFLRASCQADSLMQMGRWFGFRKGYELLPRIWMTEDTENKFRFLALLEEDLREDLKKYMYSEFSPRDYGPRIKTSPKVSWLRLTSKKHMVNAVEAEMNFTGSKPQTTLFDKDKNIQMENIRITEAFLNGLPGQPYSSFDGTSLVWDNVPIDFIKENLLIDKFHFCNRSRVFNEIGTFCNWIDEMDERGDFRNWDVIAVGNGQMTMDTAECDEKHWIISGWKMKKVVRSQKKQLKDDVIDIGALRSLKDHLDDIPEEYIPKQYDLTEPGTIERIRKAAGKDRIPMLIIYRIDAESKPRDSVKTRTALDLGTDIIGLQIVIPGEEISKNYCRKLTVRLDEPEIEDEVDNI